MKLSKKFLNHFVLTCTFLFFITQLNLINLSVFPSWSRALEPISITPEMFRVYTLDGKSYISNTAPDTEQFGARTLQSKEVYTGNFSVKIPTDSEPVMFLADLRPIGDRHFPGAWVFDPNFTTEPVGG